MITAIQDLLWLLVIAGWVLLFRIGLEADRPLSGGIPGVDTPMHGSSAPTEGISDRLGTWGGWAVLGLVSLLLPVILWWIFTVE